MIVRSYNPSTQEAEQVDGEFFKVKLNYINKQEFYCKTDHSKHLTTNKSFIALVKHFVLPTGVSLYSYVNSRFIYNIITNTRDA